MSDYTASPQTVSFLSGEPSAILTMSLTDDTIVELSEYYTVVLTSTTGNPNIVKIGSPNTSVVTIEDNEPGNICIIIMIMIIMASMARCMTSIVPFDSVLIGLFRA